MLAGAAAEHDGDAGLRGRGWPRSAAASIGATLPGGILPGRDPRPPPGRPGPRALSSRTVAVIAGRPDRAPDAPFTEPVTFASTYVAGGEVEYGRYGNPTWTAFETAVGALEGGWALAFASGLAAASAVLSLLPEGGTAVAPDNAYTGTLALLRERAAQGRAVVRAVDVATGRRRAAARARARTWCGWSPRPTRGSRSPTCPRSPRRRPGRAARSSSSTTRSRRRCCSARSRWAPTSWCTARPSSSPATPTSSWGSSAPRRRAAPPARRPPRLHGAIPGPIEAWLALRGLRTLALRVERAQAAAPVLAARLAGHPAVDRVRYPGSGTIVAIELAGGAAAADALAARRHGCGSTRPAWAGSSRPWSAAAAGRAESATVSEALVRLSVGIEDVEDLWADLAQALDRASTADGAGAGAQAADCSALASRVISIRAISRGDSPWCTAWTTASVIGMSTPCPSASVEDRPAGLHALARLLHRRGRLVRGHAAAQVDAEGAVARQRRGAGGDQVADTGQAGERRGVRAERDPQPGHLGQAAGDERGLGVLAEPEPDRDAVGERDDVLDRAAQLDAHDVGVGVRAEVRREAGQLHAAGGLLVGAGHDGGRRLPLHDLAGQVGAGHDRDPARVDVGDLERSPRSCGASFRARCPSSG